MPRGGGRDALLVATLDLIAAHGLHTVTMRDISAHAGLALGSTTYHFDDRAALLTAALTRYVADTERDVDDALGAGGGRDRGAVQSAIAAIFANRRQVLLRHELRLQATRDRTHRGLHSRTTHALRRLISAALPVGSAFDASSALAVLDTTAMHLAIDHHDPDDYAGVMTGHLARNEGPLASS